MFIVTSVMCSYFLNVIMYSCTWIVLLLYNTSTLWLLLDCFFFFFFWGGGGGGSGRTVVLSVQALRGSVPLAPTLSFWASVLGFILSWEFQWPWQLLSIIQIDWGMKAQVCGGNYTMNMHEVSLGQFWEWRNTIPWLVGPLPYLEIIWLPQFSCGARTVYMIICCSPSVIRVFI